jgi:2-phospho-L-lactate guanylyltransferase
LRAHAVIPLKDPALGKARLGEVLSAAQRAQLIDAMLRHVGSVLGAARSICDVSVLTGKDNALPQGMSRIFDGGLELNAAVARAARELRSRGESDRMVVVHADLPFVTPADIESLVAACRAEAVIAAPDWTQTGTNALAFPLARPILPRFGPGSLVKHREAAAAAGLPFVLVCRPGLAEDIDEPAQLEWLAERAGQRYEFVGGITKTIVP